MIIKESNDPLDNTLVCNGFQANEEILPSCYPSITLILSNLTVSHNMTYLLDVPTAKTGDFFIHEIEVIMSFSFSVS